MGRPRSALIVLVLLPVVIVLWVYLISLFGFEYRKLGFLRQGHPTLNDVEVVVMTDRLSVADRVMLLYYEIPKATQTATSWRSVPLTPDAAMIAQGVALVQGSEIEEKDRVLALARAGGGSYWQTETRRVVVWIAALVGSVLLGVNSVLLVLFVRARWRARKRVAWSRRGLCPACAYGLGGVDTARCPECGVEIAREVRAAQAKLRERWLWMV